MTRAAWPVKLKLGLVVVVVVILVGLILHRLRRGVSLGVRFFGPYPFSCRSLEEIVFRKSFLPRSQRDDLGYGLVVASLECR